MKYSTHLFAFALVGMALAGCAAPTTDIDNSAAPGVQPSLQPAAPIPLSATVPTPPVPATETVAPEPQREPSASEKKLAGAQGAYERGEYALAIRQLKPLTADSTLDLVSQLVALKTLAFSQCLTRAITACRKTFERAFLLDGKFDLAPAERGHPIWGPQFERARKAAIAPKGK